MTILVTILPTHLFRNMSNMDVQDKGVQDMDVQDIDPRIQEMTMRQIQSSDVILKPSSMPGGGNGLFARRMIPAGTVLPYSTIVKLVDDPDIESHEDTYFMTVTYLNNKNKFRTIGKLVADGNPRLSGLAGIKAVHRMAAYVNESSNCPPNCIFVDNPAIDRDSVYKSLARGTPMASTLLIVPHDIKQGKELFTLYGSDYQRGYKVWRDRRDAKNDMIIYANDIAEYHVEEIRDMFKVEK